jgi:hypothetical protein
MMEYGLPARFTEKREYRSLKKAWIGFRIAKRNGDQKK